MSSLLTSWNAIANGWLSWLLERSLIATVALAVIGGVLLILRRRVSAHAPSHLLLLPVLLLFVPLEDVLPTTWAGVVPNVASLAVGGERVTEASGPAEARREAAPIPATGAVAAAGPVPDVHPVVGPADRVETAALPEPAAIAFALWLGLIVYGALRLVLAHGRCEARLRRLGQRPSASMQRLFDRLCSERGFDAPIQLRVVAGLASPIATGIRHRSVCLPPTLGRMLSPSQLRFVLLHELEHHARHDVAVEGVLRLARVAFWFHPVTWIVLAAHRRWREYACDEAAVARAGSPRRAPVADALFTLIRLAHAADDRPVAIASFSPSTNIMKNRLERILDRTRSPLRSLSGASLLVVAATGLCALTLARAQDPGASPPAAAEESQQGTAQATGLVRVRRANDPVASQPLGEPRGEVAIAIDQGIAWLLANQHKDGCWDIGPDPEPRYPRDHNVAHVTGLAVRAVLQGYKGPRHIGVVRSVERADDWLRRSQNPSGLFGGGEVLNQAYGHAQVLRALCAIQRVIPEDERLKVIAKGVEYALRTRNPYAGWRYVPRDGDNDSKHTALMLLALHDAAQLGVAVEQQAFECARILLTELTDRGTGRTGFVRCGEPMSRFVAKLERFPRQHSEEPTAMRLLVEQAFADSHADGEVLALSAARVSDVPPVWDTVAGTIDYAYWCFGARAMAGVGGDQAQAWRRSLHTALLPNRVIEGDSAHWPANDPWSREGMEAYSTASCVLALAALR